MPKILKTFFYIIASALVFLLLVSMYSTAPVSQPANAFTEWEKQVQVYFWNDEISSDSSDCSLVHPVSRTILNAETFGPGALESLLQGVTAEEKSAGYGTAINSGVLVQRFEIRDRVAYVDFNSELNKGVAGSCRVIALRSQIETTLNNLPDIDSVVVSINNETEGILEP